MKKQMKRAFYAGKPTKAFTKHLIEIDQFNAYVKRIYDFWDCRSIKVDGTRITYYPHTKKIVIRDAKGDKHGGVK